MEKTTPPSAWSSWNCTLSDTLSLLKSRNMGMANFFGNSNVFNVSNNRHKYFVIFSQIVRKYFCIQATSCSAERTFSTGGSTVTAKRSKLDPENVNKLVYLRENLGKVKIESWCWKMMKRKRWNNNAWLKLQTKINLINRLT